MSFRNSYVAKRKPALDLLPNSQWLTFLNLRRSKRYRVARQGLIATRDVY